jgi:HAD superfamily hydrolase (TIGR01509 family)
VQHVHAHEKPAEKDRERSMSPPHEPRLRVQGVIFDMDGTLADSLDHYYGMACEVVEAAHAPPISRERVCELMGSGDPNLLRKLLPPDFPDSEAILARIVGERFSAWMRAGREIEPLPGCIDLLHQLHARGHRLGIATSSGRALPCLDRWGVRQLFDAIVGREDVVRRKPHPDVVVHCLRRLSLAPDDAVYVGDSPIDIEAGRAAGVYTVGVLTGTSTREVLASVAPDHILASAPELLDLLER